MSLPDIQVEIAFDSGWSTPAADRTWTDVSQYVEVHDGVSIGVGRGDEFATADANTLALTLDNTDGRFTPGNASSPYFPNVKVGRPIRVSLPSGFQNLLTNPGFEVDTADWSAVNGATLSRSMAQAWEGAASGLVTWPTGGLPGAFIFASGLAIGRTYTFSAYVWVPVGSVPVRLEAFAITAGLGSTEVAAWQRLQVSWVATSTSQAVLIVPHQPATSGHTVYLDGALVNEGAAPLNWQDLSDGIVSRFVGYLDSVPVAWDGGSDDYAKVSVTASSRIARLGVARTLRSIVEEEFRKESLAAYYTMGEAEGATQANDSSGEGRPPVVMVGSGADVVFGNATGPGTDDLTAAEFAGGKYLAADVDFSLNSTDGYWIACSINTAGVTAGVFSLNAGDFELFLDTLGDIRGRNTAFVDGPVINDSETHTVVFTADTTNNLRLFVDGVLEDTSGSAPTPTLDVSSIWVGGAAATASSFTGTGAHFVIGTGVLTEDRVAELAAALADGFEGDTPGDRLTRYAALAAIPADEIEVDTGTLPMAHIDTTGVTALEMMRKVEQTEGGVLFDAVDGTLTFHHRARRYIAESALTVDVADHILEPDYSPQFDLQTLTNVATAKLGDETVTATAVNSDSVDDYGSRSVEIELYTSDVNEPHAAAWWRVNTYGEPVPRVPTLSVNLLGLDADTVALILGLSVGSRITVTGLPSQAANDTEDYFIEGYAEAITLDRYVLTFNVSPAEPYLSTWVLNSATRSQLGTTTRLAY